VSKVTELTLKIPPPFSSHSLSHTKSTPYPEVQNTHISVVLSLLTVPDWLFTEIVADGSASCRWQHSSL